MTTEERRRWFHWHRSTWVFLALLCIPYGLIALPTATFDDKNERAQSIWPTIHCAQIEDVGLDSFEAARDKLDRDLFDSSEGLLVDHDKTPAENDARLFFWSINPYIQNKTAIQFGVTPQKFWSDSRNWQLWNWQRVSRYFPLGLIINLASFGLFILLTGGSMELLRRRKKQWYQITLLEYSFLLVLVGGGTVITLNAHQDVAVKTKAMRDFAQSSPTQQTGWIRVNPPVWFERLTNLSFDMEARGQWNGWVNTNSPDSSIPLPYFSKLDTLNFSNIVDLEKAISAVEELQPNSLRVTLRQKGDNRVIELIEKVNPDGVKHLELELPGKSLSGSPDVEENFLRQFNQLESIRLVGNVRHCHLIAASKISVKSIGVVPQLNESMLDELLKMKKLEGIFATIPAALVPKLEQLPRNLSYLSLTIARPQRIPVKSIDFRHIPTLKNLKYLSLGIPVLTGENDSNVTLGSLDRFTQLQSLTLLPLYESPRPIIRGEEIVVPTLGGINMEHRPIPSLTTLEIGPFAFDDETLDWIKSHQQLKRLYLHRTVNPGIRDQMKTELPHLEQW